MLTSDSAKSNAKVAVFGEAIIDLIEQQPDCYEACIGGSPFNVARGFVNQQIECTYLSPISTDKYGEQILALAKQSQIHTIQALRSNKPSSLALVYKDENQQPDYRLYRSGVADLDVDATTLLSNIPKDINVFHTGSLAMVPSMQAVLLPVFSHLQQQGCAISIDINIRKGVESDHSAYVDCVWDMAKHANILKFSDEDLLLCGISEDPIAYAQRFQKQSGCEFVVLTLGNNGAYLFTHDSQHFQANFKAQQVVDTVGAGDTFFSAFVAQILYFSGDTSSAQLDYALAYGSIAACMNVEKSGCQPPTRQAVLARLSS